MKVRKSQFLSLFLVAISMAAIAVTQQDPRTAGSGVKASGATGEPKMVATFAKLPMSFEANQGQADPRAKFISRGKGYRLFLGRDGAELSLRKVSQGNRKLDRSAKLEAGSAQASSSEVVTMKLVGSNRAAEVRGVDRLPGKSNYFIGNDPNKWHRNVPTYARVKYESVYPGIDLVYYGNQQQLEYDFVVAPGANPKSIQFSLAGLNPKRERSSKDGAIRIDENGDLVIQTTSGDVRLLKPVVYQTALKNQDAGASDRQSSARDRQLVDGHFVLLAANRVGFEVGAYDKTRTLIIDPVLSYSSYLGASNFDFGISVAADASGNVYVSGASCTTDPVNDSSGCDATATKINAAGTAVLYSTVLGGSGNNDDATAIALDPLANVYVTGITCSPDFPVTAGAFKATLGGTCDAFITKLDASGNTLYSTYLGGSKGKDNFDASDVGTGIAADSTGNAYVVGQTCSTDFPTKNAFQTFQGGLLPCDAFVTKLNPAGGGSADLLYSTYLGGATEEDHAENVTLDSSNLVYVVGQAGSPDFPTTSGAFQTKQGGVFDEFITKFDLTKSGKDSLLYSTFLGGSLQEQDAAGIAVDSTGKIYVTGTTISSDFPVTPGAFQTSAVATGDPNVVTFNGFVSKLNPVGQGASDLVYSTYFGQSRESGNAIAVGPTGSIYIAGDSCSGKLPVTNDALQSSPGGGQCDGFVAKLNPAGQGSSDLAFATYLGGASEDFASGIALDGNGNAYVVGETQSSNFPHTSDAPRGTLSGNSDSFVARIPIGNFSIPPISTITVDVGGSGKSSVTVNSSGEFNAPVNLSVSGQPSGVTALLDPNPLTPSAGGSQSSSLTVNLGLAATPGAFSLHVKGDSGLLTHSASAQVIVRASTEGTGTVIDGITAAGCIDNAGISGALINKLNQAQSSIDAGQIQDAINTLSALLNQLQAQSGKHIHSSCTVNGQTFNPVDVLFQDVRAILASLKVANTPNPVMGYVVNGSNAGVGGVTVNILNTLDTATSDATGFYFFANTGSLSVGTSFTAQVAGFPAASQSFTWQGSTITLPNLVVNSK
ncbi:MAG TPA: SBBP repeat-containing protein [Terriglobales bacterium]|nr:SBBP repeat-containing protein [Terriglobales bacterium]